MENRPPLLTAAVNRLQPLTKRLTLLQKKNERVYRTLPKENRPSE